MLKKTFLCRSHPDFHMPADVEIGRGFDGDALGRRLAECHADAVAIFAKCHYGHAYYDTKIGTRHPRLTVDMLREAVEGCHRHGVGVIGYYSTFLDTCAAREHPDWAARRADGTARGGNYTAVCVNSPYVDELLIPQMREILTGYDVDEVLLDTMSNFEPCYCEHCKASFGGDIPLSDEDPRWQEYVHWYAARFDGFFARVAAALRETNPEVPVVFNWMWGTRIPTPPPPGIGRLCADDRGSGTIASLHCRFFAGTGYPCDYFTGRFLHGLGDWNSAPDVSLQYTAAASVANGSTFWLIDRMLPDGSLDEPAYDSMKAVFGFVKERADWLIDARHVPEVAVLHAWSTLVGDNMQFYAEPRTRRERSEAFEGVSRMLMEHGRHYTALAEHTLNARVGDYRLVIVPEQEFLSEQTIETLTGYVEAGGRVLITQATEGTPDPRLLELAGVEFDGLTGPDYGYVDAEPPVVIRGKFARIRATEAEVLRPYIIPLGAEERAASFGHGFAPPTEPGFPAVTARKLGRGEVIYVAAPAFKSYCNYQSYLIAGLLLELMDRLLPDPVVKVSTPAQVEMVAMRRADDLIIHLVNHSGRERLGGYHWPVTEYVPEVRDVRVMIKATSRTDSVLHAPSERMRTRMRDGYAELVLPGLHVMETLVVPDYFKLERP